MASNHFRETDAILLIWKLLKIDERISKEDGKPHQNLKVKLKYLN